AFEELPTAGIREWHELPEPRNPGQVGHARRCCGSTAQLRHERLGCRAVELGLALVPLPSRASPAIPTGTRYLVQYPRECRGSSKIKFNFYRSSLAHMKSSPLCSRNSPLRLSCHRRNLVDAWRSITAPWRQDGAH